MKRHTFNIWQQKYNIFSKSIYFSFQPSASENSISCIVCGEANFESSSALAEHRSENHLYKCLDCDKEYKLTDSLRKHVKITHNENVTMTCCKYCDKVIMDTSQKADHMAKMHPILSPQNNQNHPQNHLQNHPSQNRLEPLTIGYPCPKCPKFFKEPDTLTKHAKFFHNLHVSFCIDCKLSFTDDMSKNQHLVQVHPHLVQQNQKSLLKSISILEQQDPEDGNQSAYKCPKCPKTYNIGKSLRKHCRKNHNKLSICFCQHCPKVRLIKCV